MRIGILGGTFDPPHNGHVSLAVAAIEQLELDELIFVPANRNPLKTDKPDASCRHRLAMVERLVEVCPKMSFSDVEIARGGPSYAVETVGALQMVRPGEYWFIMGADALRGLPGWKSPERLVKLCRLAVAVRPPLIPADVQMKLQVGIKERVDIVRMPPLEISSTELKERLRNREIVNPWIAPKVLEYIETHKLYNGS